MLEKFKGYPEFLLGYFVVPSTPTFYLLEKYIDPLWAYFISLSVWGTVFFIWTNRKRFK